MKDDFLCSGQPAGENSTPALDSSQHSDETTTGKHGSSEHVTAGQQGEWVLLDLLLRPVILADL